MTKSFKTIGLALSACLLASCATHYEAPRMAAAPQRPMAPSAPAGHLAPGADDSLAVQASAFESYMRRARAIDAGFSSPAEVAHALQTGAAHEPHELEAGMIAYAAMAALQEPRFVAAVRSGGQGLARRISADPQIALLAPGGDAAAARAAGALYAQGAGLLGEGEKVKHAAYAVQHQAWSKAKVADPAGRLNRVKRISTEAYQPSREDAAQLQTALAQGARRPGQPSAVVAHGVALAALSVLGEGGRAQSLMSEPRTSSCLRMAKLNLYQCLASAGPHYEDIFCLGQHAMIDTGQCVVEATRGPGPRQMAMTQAAYGR